MNLPSWRVSDPVCSNWLLTGCSLRGGSLVQQREHDIEHALERRDRDALGRLVVALGAVGQVDDGQAELLERVGVRAATRGDPPWLVARGAQGRLGGDDGGRGRLLAVAGEQPLRDD